ncbi:Hsp70 family protein [uncultured Maribacter sp.]|uniref:Hsp70 family protein n=1 Tax=uncultured Maribacter sp. TaxID=431308 RepID=UPI00260271D1|nr:Hsp70 family protein [uncultured Maribacter sp.]
MKTINFGIDLGTTNSLIAKYNDGEIEVFKNPLGQKATLASAVAFRGKRILVGDKARNLLEKDPLNVFTCFKRKMGTTDAYFVENLKKEITPIELSSFVLQELKNFIHTGEEINEVVITIPSSFDTIQSNATKTAGIEAGFKKVYLLQEPIAASLAFANKNNLQLEEEKKWLVYDYGGGTFDVALLQIDEREMNVLDNEGDNFLGGMDFDNLIIEKLVIPQLEKELKEENLWEKFKQKENTYQKLYFELLYRAEEAKKELSRFETTEIEIDIDDKDFYTSITINRKDFNSLIEPSVQRTITLAKKILESNGCRAKDIEKVILVGGSTLIPYVKERIQSSLGIEIDSSVEPTAAVGIGAAYYAGTKIAQIEETKQEPSINPIISATPEYEIIYQKNSQDIEELISVIPPENIANGSYRITRLDGGFDTGLVTITDEISCFVDLLEGQKNRFNLKIYEPNGTLVYENNNITIIHGKYNIQGQLLPHDICLEIDDIDYGVTRLEAIFNKNAVLPLKRTIYKTATKNILLGSEEKLQINIVEGDDGSLPSSGLSIGFIEISGGKLEKDLIKGTDIEIDISVSESRDIDVTIFLSSCEQEFRDSFKPTQRSISISKIEKEIYTALNNIEKEIKNNDGEYELLAKFQKIRESLIELQIELSLCNENDSTDTKFKIDNNKQILIKEFDQLTRFKALDSNISEYQLKLAMVKNELSTISNEFYEKKLEKILLNEKEVLNSGNKYLIKSKIKELEQLDNELFNQTSENFISPFLYYKSITEYKESKRAEKLIIEGDKALEKQQYDVVKHVVYQLHALLPEHLRNDKKVNFNDQDKTGLS